MGAEAAVLGRRTRRTAPAPRRSERRLSLGAAAQRWSATAGAELGRSIRSQVSRANIAAAIFLALVAAFHVRTGIEVDRLGYALSHARVVRQQLAHELELLRVEYAAAISPERLERTAFERLGMTPPPPGRLVVLR